MKITPKRFRWMMNLYPPYFFTRTKVLECADDWRFVRVKLKKSFLTRNYFGTAFGGSLYAATDPFLVLMLVQILGNDYIIWDKSASIDFLKPVKKDITFDFKITNEDLENIHHSIQEKGKTLVDFQVNGIDADGQHCVTVHKVIYLRKKLFNND